MAYEFEEWAPEYPEDDYPRSGDEYRSYREWIGSDARFLDFGDVPEHWLRFAEDEISIDLCGVEIGTLTRSEFDRL